MQKQNVGVAQHHRGSPCGTTQQLLRDNGALFHFAWLLANGQVQVWELLLRVEAACSDIQGISMGSVV